MSARHIDLLRDLSARKRDKEEQQKREEQRAQKRASSLRERILSKPSHDALEEEKLPSNPPDENASAEEKRLWKLKCNMGIERRQQEAIQRMQDLQSARKVKEEREKLKREWRAHKAKSYLVESCKNDTVKEFLESKEKPRALPKIPPAGTASASRAASLRRRDSAGAEATEEDPGSQTPRTSASSRPSSSPNLEQAEVEDNLVAKDEAKDETKDEVQEEAKDDAKEEAKDEAEKSEAKTEKLKPAGTQERKSLNSNMQNGYISKFVSRMKNAKMAMHAARDMAEWKKRMGCPPDKQVFICCGGYMDFTQAMLKRGWFQNEDKDSRFFDIKWAPAASIDHESLVPEQVVNHFAGNREITTKVGLTLNLRNCLSMCGADPDYFYPRAYDLYDPQERAEFVLNFKFTKAQAVLRELLRNVESGAEVTFSTDVVSVASKMCMRLVTDVDDVIDCDDVVAEALGNVSKAEWKLLEQVCLDDPSQRLEGALKIADLDGFINKKHVLTEAQKEREAKEKQRQKEKEKLQNPVKEEKKKKKKKKKKVEEGKNDKGDEDDEEGGVKEEIITAVSRAVYAPDSGDGVSKVLFTGSGKYEGYLWEIPLNEVQESKAAAVPLEKRTPATVMCAVKTKLPKGVAVSHMSLSPSKRILFVGFADGRIWAITLDYPSNYSTIYVSDAVTGGVNAVSIDKDETLLCTASGDGTLSTVNINAEGLRQLAGLKAGGAEVDMADASQQLTDTMPDMPDVTLRGWDLPSQDAGGISAITGDITDSQVYSIQDAKLKAEEDNAKAAAELKKQRVRERISEIRDELTELQGKNGAIVEGQLSMNDMAIDQEYIQHLKDDMEKQIEQVNFELSWAVEFHETGLQKIKDHYLQRVDFERVEVLGFQSPHRVATFRCPAMSEDLQSNLARLHELIFAAEAEHDEDKGDLDDGELEDGKAITRGLTKNDSGFEGSGDEAGEQSSEKVLSGAEQRELRRQQRAQRKGVMQELEKAKPNESYKDPADIEAIAHAEATLGNYMLKTSDSYQVPENQRMNAEKKRRQMFLLEESMHAIKTEFNHRVLALRDFRQQVRAEVQRDLLALHEINDQLGTTTDWIAGLLDNPPGTLPEFPEQRFAYEDQHIKAFARAQAGSSVQEDEAEEEEEEEGEDEEGEGEDEEGEEGEGEDEEYEEEGAEEEGEEHAGDKKAAKKPKAAPGAPGPNVPLSGRAALAARRVARLTLRAQLLQAKSADKDSLASAVAVESQARLRHDKGQLEEHIKQVVETFNTAVASIEKEKAKLESDLKNADMKLLVLYEELLTLNELEEKDEALLKKATKCRQDKTSIMHQIKECQDQLSEKKAEIEAWHTEEQNLQAEFTDMVGENSPFLSALLKIYKKKVKRSKRKKGMEEEEDFEDDEDDEDEGSDVESDEEDDMEDEDSGPPAGCDHQIYESVIDLRDKRLEMEDALAEIQKAVEGLKQTHKKLLDDERRIDKEQKMTDAEIQQFQTDKQRKLNQVPIVFALRLSQVQMLAQDESDMQERMPPELDKHVVFTHEGLNRLMSRITELHQEIKQVKAGHKQLQKDFRVRKKDKNVALQHIEDLQAKFQDIQMLKFGQIVDLDLIERSAPNKYVQELQEKVLQAETEGRRRLADWDKKIEKQKKELAKITQDNTSLMEQIVSMGYSQMQLDAALNARIANVTVNDNEPLQELREMERERCKDLLALQAKEIATLQAEINLFRKKGGHIYTTVTANRR
mmetsp:Transcript_12213/g.21666  ORF Transcript_12213/g.21666 Transcript_12213/m.21666 type:complete len:1730 (-) Transcript_12213:223-5412(-)